MFTLAPKGETCSQNLTASRTVMDMISDLLIAIGLDDITYVGLAVFDLYKFLIWASYLQAGAEKIGHESTLCRRDGLHHCSIASRILPNRDLE